MGEKFKEWRTKGGWKSSKKWVRVNKKERKGGKRRGRKLQDSRDVKNKIRKELEEIQWIEDKQSESEKRRKRRNEWKERGERKSRFAFASCKYGYEIWENVQEKGIIRARDGRGIRRVKCEDYTARAITLMGRARKLVSISFSKGRE